MADRASSLHGTPRICMPVFSSFANHAYRTGLMEAQDVLGECVDVDRIDLRARWDFRLKESWLSRAAYHGRLRLFERMNPGLHAQRVTQDYDAFIAVCPNWRDLVNLNAVSGWEERCKVSICWIDELWAQEVRELGPWLRQLRRFDHVFVGIAGTARALELAIDKTCHELAGAVDAFRFCPVPTAPRRVIDLYSVGRRVEPIHAGMRRLAERRQLFYVYDTAASGDTRVSDYRAHRQMYAETAKRSRLFAMAPGKVDVHQTTGGQVDIGYRCFEGSAAGAVLVGAPPDSD